VNAQQPVIILVAGPNGSGKTSITRAILQHKWMKGCEYINPDDIAQNEFGDWNNRNAILRAAQKAASLREQFLAERKSFAFESVFSASDKVEFLERSKEAGFFIRVFFIGTKDPTINASRIAGRVLEGGHDVPITKIVSRYSKSIAHCAAAVRIVDRLYVYDNSVDFRKPLLLFRTANGAMAKEYLTSMPWAKGIRDAVVPARHLEVVRSAQSISSSR